MYDYGKLVFLDNQKTGSTYVSQFLEACCALDKVKSGKHAPVRGGFNKDALYFSTVRSPFDLYVSLYRYGKDRKGSTWKGLRKLRRLDLYESLPKWLDFVLDAENAPTIQPGYEKVSHLGVGLMSYRAMWITLQYPLKTMTKSETYDHLIEAWSKRSIAGHIFRQEELKAGLMRLSTETAPEFFKQDEVREFLGRPDRVNASSPRSELVIPDEQKRKIKDKERFLIERFYPDRPSEQSLSAG